MHVDAMDKFQSPCWRPEPTLHEAPHRHHKPGSKAKDVQLQLCGVRSCPIYFFIGRDAASVRRRLFAPQPGNVLGKIQLDELEQHLPQSEAQRPEMWAAR